MRPEAAEKLQQVLQLVKHLAAEPEVLPPRPSPTSSLHQQHTWHVPEATPTSGADSSGFLLRLVHRVGPSRSAVKGGLAPWTRTPVDLPQGSPWTSAGLSRTPAHLRRARALLSLLISAGLTSIPTESNCDSSRLSATVVPDRRRNRAAAPPAAFRTSRTARTFRTSRASEVLDPLTHHAAALSPRGVSLSTRPGDTQPTFTRTEVLTAGPGPVPTGCSEALGPVSCVRIGSVELHPP